MQIWKLLLSFILALIFASVWLWILKENFIKDLEDLFIPVYITLFSLFFFIFVWQLKKTEKAEGIEKLLNYVIPKMSVPHEIQGHTEAILDILKKQTSIAGKQTIINLIHENIAVEIKAMKSIGDYSIEKEEELKKWARTLIARIQLKK